MRGENVTATGKKRGGGGGLDWDGEIAFDVQGA